MGNWTIHIDGHGIHDNGLSEDADQRLKAFVEQLLLDGHTVNHATISVGTVRRVVPSSEEAPAHLVNQP